MKYFGEIIVMIGRIMECVCEKNRAGNPGVYVIEQAGV